MGLFDWLFDDKERNKLKLKPLSLTESKKKCKEIKATPKEIKEAKIGEMYICERCGYHQGRSWDGKIRRCKGCGGWLKYWQLYERILERRGN